MTNDENCWTVAVRMQAARGIRPLDGPDDPGGPDDSIGADLVASMDSIEFCNEEGVFRASYDDSCDRASMAVLAVISAAERSDPLDLPPLQSATDVDALDQLFRRSDGGGSASFHYDEFDVTVFDDGTIEVERDYS
ncbi:HalOD1 output domain-containing protein [Natronoarchaeum rubrum]|uniref:HalOD1 output domain-containing protein n=1 Tax=Natronoarchaeum rubrum TaxID=755311 RepID=UPI002110EA41|nr:HalOD1 output domain-containing protein [Natronoarchaeum rubrum]